VLAAICDALECTPNDLIEPTATTTHRRKPRVVNADPSPREPSKRDARPTRVRLVDPE
ncbi:MAG: helix-turn-helix domain-containing protein, partial [Mycobacterium sp.]|nr:helix-turn-helix domain-containing protein [Mycobacterium sp.]